MDLIKLLIKNLINKNLNQIKIKTIKRITQREETVKIVN